jgi:hypothetical protein
MSDPGADAGLYRQGDILLRRVDTLPAAATVVARRGRRIVIAEGETTGHAHAIDAPPDEATLLTTAENARFLRLTSVVELRHEEHAPIALAPGIYEVIQQREWTDADDQEERWRYARD